MTYAQKLLARKARADRAEPGSFIVAEVDRVLGNELSTFISVEDFNRLGLPRLARPDRVIIIPDHFTPAKDVRTAELCAVVRRFAREQGIEKYLEVGRAGIEHIVLPQQGWVGPGELVVGGDSHTCTYGGVGALGTGIGSTDLLAAMVTGKMWFRVPETIRIELEGKPDNRWTGAKDYALLVCRELGFSGGTYSCLEYGGGAIRELELPGRFTLCNMGIETGAKFAVVPPDGKSYEYAKEHGWEGVPADGLAPSPDADYQQRLSLDVSGLPPLVAKPHLPSNSVPVEEVAGTKVDQVLIGSCTNGWLSDLRLAAEITGGKSVHPDVRLIVTPGSQQVFLEAVNDGTIARLIEAGAAVTASGCGACPGGHQGVIGAGEVCLSTTNRNFRGRMGSPDSEVYLAGTAVAAATALAGEIASPDMI